MSGGEKTWFSAAELADLRLPGLPTSKRKVNERASAEGWALKTDAAGRPLARPRAGRGGGLEYHLDALPTSVRARLAPVPAPAPAPAAAPEPANDPRDARADAQWRWFDGLNETAKVEARRRLEGLRVLEALEAAGMTRSAAVTAASGRIGVGASTFWSWLAMVERVSPSDWLAYLAPRRGGGGAEAKVDAQVYQLIVSDYLRAEAPTFSSCYYRAKIGYADPRGIVLQNERTFRRKMEREIDPRAIVARREGAEALRRMLPPQERSVLGLHALEAVNIDGHTFDVFVRWPDGRVGRPKMVAVQDLYSRKIVARRIDETENALATRLVFADLFREWGIPRACLLDNGRAFTAKSITGGAKTRFRFKIKPWEPTGVLTAFGVAIHWATPYRGQSKPIERAFRDLCDTIAKHPELAGAYTGNRPDAKPENYGSRAVPIADFAALVDREIAAHNARPGRRTETARGRSFDDAFAESYAAAPIGRATPEQLRMAMLTAEDRPCDKKTATITLEGNRYWAPELARYAGERLIVRFDPDNLHGDVHVYDRQDQFIVTAPAIVRTGFFDKTAARDRRAQEKAHRAATREAERHANLLGADQIAALLTPEHATPAPVPTVIRPVRHRGSAAALKPLPEPSQVQLEAEAAVDRLADRTARRLRLVD